mmetsp:Transcript_939/g.3932  ORF Transcript_939/g.3932 Transcript_939/m.3932 type:complete len:162 (+) Transcript_939:1316-1801(+)
MARTARSSCVAFSSPWSTCASRARGSDSSRPKASCFRMTSSRRCLQRWTTWVLREARRGLLACLLLMGHALDKKHTLRKEQDDMQNTKLLLHQRSPPMFFRALNLVCYSKSVNRPLALLLRPLLLQSFPHLSIPLHKVLRSHAPLESFQRFSDFGKQRLTS